jgi:sodium transport system permease protein
MAAILVIFKKELKDILRDTRALLTVSLVSILAGPIILLMISNMLAGFESRAERRIVVVHGIEHAPTLENFLLRETAQIETAPNDYEQALITGRLVDPVLVVPEDFEEKWRKGEPQILTIMTNSSNARINAGLGRLKRWVGGLANEHALISSAIVGFSANANDMFGFEEVDLANARAQSVKIFTMLPYFLVLAALYGVWGSALETTVGEKERGTLEPLLVIPHRVWRVILGKWLAVSSIGVFITTLAVFSFIPAQKLMQSEVLKTMFSFGWPEFYTALTLVLPLTGLFAALLMFVGAIAKSTRQAQANTTLVLLLCTFMPMIAQMQMGAQQSWHAWLPMVAQHHHILQMLKGDALNWCAIIGTALISIVFSVAFLGLTMHFFQSKQHR